MAEKLASDEVNYEPICPHYRKVLGIGVRKSALIN